MSDVFSVLTSAFPEAEIRTGVSPAVRIATAPDPARRSLLLKFLQPSVTLIDANGSPAYTLAPYGEPNPRTTAVRFAAVFAGVALTLTIAFLAGRATRG